MILDYGNMGLLEAEFTGGRVLVDGVEVQQVRYIDTDKGIVETFDVDDSHLPKSAPCGTKALTRWVTGDKVEVFRKDGTLA